MTISAQNPSDRARQLVALTQRLTKRLEAETTLLEAHRPQDLYEGIEETRALSNLYRHETTRIKADSSLLAGITAVEKQGLFEATEAFQDQLAHYERAVTAAKTISEGIITSVADDLNAQRATTSVYGARGRTQSVGPQSLNFGKSA